MSGKAMNANPRCGAKTPRGTPYHVSAVTERRLRAFMKACQEFLKELKGQQP